MISKPKKNGRTGTGSGPHVVVVDDEPRMLSALDKHLTRQGYQPTCCLTAAAALKVLESQPVAVVITDQRMPGMDGVELLDIVADRWPKTGRVLLSAWIEDVRDVCERRGHVVIEKFQDSDVLVGVLKDLTGKSDA